MLLLIAGCAGAGLEYYQTTGRIYALESMCLDDGATFHTQESGVHLIGLEICGVHVCRPAEYTRVAAAFFVDCSEQADGAGAYARARLLELGV